jgi:NADPH2:quinone reductase
MRAWLLDALAGIDGLRLDAVADPSLKPSQALLRVEYAALNPADRYLAEGAYPARPLLPHILGRDGVGTITALGPNATGFSVGDKVLILRGETGVSAPGTFAEQVAVTVESLMPLPPGWSDREFAGAALVYLTAYQALTQWPDLPAASSILITGASGGVGVASLHLAKALGHRVVALSRDPAKQARLAEIGADIVLDSADPHWPKTAKQRLAGGVDLAIDNIGGPSFLQIIETMNFQGRVSCVGALAGPVPKFNTPSLFFRRLKLGGVAVSTYSAPESRAAWTRVVELLTAIGQKPLVDSVFAFEDLKPAFARLAAGPMGKVLIAVKRQ